VAPSCSYIAAGAHSFEASTDAAWTITGAGGRVLAGGPGSLRADVEDPPVQASAQLASFGHVPAVEGEIVTITVTGAGTVRAGGTLGD
jgi:hypothetical protein